jgi:hypothetical protein
MEGHQQPKPTWEKITENLGVYVERTERLEVPGGWIYRTICGATQDGGIALCFVPKPLREVA